MTELGVAVPLAAAAAASVAGWWADRAHQSRKERLEEERRAAEELVAKRKAERRRLLESVCVLRTNKELWKLVEGHRQTAVVAVGGAAAGQLPGFLECMRRADAASWISATLLVEPDRRSRDICLERIPEEFRDRVVVVDFPQFPAGFLGRSIAEVLELAPYWRDDLEVKVTAWRNLLRLQGVEPDGAYPVQLIVLSSPGPSGVLACDPIRGFKEDHDQGYAYLGMVLDHKDDRRHEHVPALLRLYERLVDDKGVQLIKGYLIGDNRRWPELYDQFLALLFAAMTMSWRLDPTPQPDFNILPDTYRKYRVATLAGSVHYLPVKRLAPFHDEPEAFFTDLTQARKLATRGIAEVRTQPYRQALPLERAPGPEFVFAVSAIRPDPEMGIFASQVRRSVQPTLTHETTLGVASIGYPMHERTERAPLTVLSVFPVLGGIDAVIALAQGQDVEEKFVKEPDALTTMNGRAGKLGQENGQDVLVAQASIAEVSPPLAVPPAQLPGGEHIGQDSEQGTGEVRAEGERRPSKPPKRRARRRQEEAGQEATRNESD